MKIWLVGLLIATHAIVGFSAGMASLSWCAKGKSEAVLKRLDKDTTKVIPALKVKHEKRKKELEKRIKIVHQTSKHCGQRRIPDDLLRTIPGGVRFIQNDATTSIANHRLSDSRD